MLQLPPALAGLADYRQFLLYKLVWDEAKQKNHKYPVNPHTLAAYPKGSDWQKDPAATVGADEAIMLADAAGPDHGVAFLFTERDPFYFVDLDNCLINSAWSPTAQDIMNRLAGAAIEVSQSGTGLHIFGQGTPPQDHSNRNTPLGLEFYTWGRFVALTGTNAIGDCRTNTQAAMAALCATYFPTKVAAEVAEWTTEACDEWNGPTDDTELLSRAMATASAASAFGTSASFADLWTANEDVLARAYPDQFGHRAYDGSQADAALAQHLAFWTGNNCERMQRLMQQSALVRDKWDRDDYLPRTILRAVGLQHQVYGARAPGSELAEQYGAVTLKAASPAQREYAERIRAGKLLECQSDPAMVQQVCGITEAKTFLNNQDKSPDQLVNMTKPVEQAATPMGPESYEPELLTGYQYLGPSQQIDYFAGCAYVQEMHKIFTPSGALLKSEQFNATYGGYVFQLDETGDKTTRKAWEAFTESQVVRYTKVEGTAFRPELSPGAILVEDGQRLVNTYIPVETPRMQGDPAPFLDHLRRVLPVESDRAILLAYMAACIQHKGVKFQWAPLLQGAEGNGKTLFTRCVAAAIGRRYTHLPPASELAEKFNDWLFNKLFIGVEDVLVPEHKREILEVLKPMITNDRLAMRAMQQGQVMGDNRANFILNSNHQDAIRKTKNDRRFAVFFTAQQTAEDVAASGMGGDYFPKLYDWLKHHDGYAIVSDYLARYTIPDALNPATHCHRAPNTSTTHLAVAAGLGAVEQEILEAIEEGRQGFAGGWVSSIALDKLLERMRAGRAIPQNKRRALLQSLGYDWHPSLPNGRTNNLVAIDGGKPRLFIKDGHIHRNLATPAEVVNHYSEAQGAGKSAIKAGEAFSNG